MKMYCFAHVYKLSVCDCHHFFLKLSDGLDAVPMTQREKLDCSSVLSPQQLKLVDIGKCNSN